MTSSLHSTAEKLDDLPQELINAALNQESRKKGNWVYVWFNPSFENKTGIYIGTTVWTKNNGNCYFELQGSWGIEPFKTIEADPLQRVYLVASTLRLLESRPDLLWRADPPVLEILYVGDEIESTIPEMNGIHGVFFIPTQDIDISTQL